MSKRATLESLVERGFAEGYAEFKDLVDRQAQAAAVLELPARDQAMLRIHHLLTVAMVEGCRDAEDQFGISPLEAIFTLWRANGIALAMMNGQLFDRMSGPVEQQMFSDLREVYRKAAKDMVAPDAAEGKAQ